MDWAYMHTRITWLSGGKKKRMKNFRRNPQGNCRMKTETDCEMCSKQVLRK
jgi:hypothetical protein